MSYITPVMEGVDKNHQIDSVYTDFASAFDLVDHKILIDKLQNQYGISNEILDWFRSYLENREQVVVIAGYESKKYIASSGVPQGSHLGPILFLLFINDIVDCVRHCHCLLFADDMKISRQVDSLTDVELIQADLDRIYEWCCANRMTLNASKCQHIRFTRKRKVLASSYHINTVRIAIVEQLRDLGVILDSRLSFVPHCDDIVQRAAKMLGFIRRNTKDFRHTASRILLYNALVRSVLEFGSVIWNPHYMVHSNRIESIQRSFTRQLAFLATGFSARCSYDERLRFFHMSSLQLRRRMIDLLCLRSIVDGSFKSDGLLERIEINVPKLSARRKCTSFFNVPRYKTNLGRNAPMARLTSTYNNFCNIYDLDIFHDHHTRFRSKIIKEGKTEVNITYQTM